MIDVKIFKDGERLCVIMEGVDIPSEVDVLNLIFKDIKAIESTSKNVEPVKKQNLEWEEKKLKEKVAENIPSIEAQSNTLVDTISKMDIETLTNTYNDNKEKFSRLIPRILKKLGKTEEELLKDEKSLRNMVFYLLKNQ